MCGGDGQEVGADASHLGAGAFGSRESGQDQPGGAATSDRGDAHIREEAGGDLRGGGVMKYLSEVLG